MHRVPVHAFGLFAALTVLAAPSPAQSEPTPPAQRYVVVPQARPTGDVTFQSVVDLQQHPSAMAPQLRGAREANTDEWPASFYLTFASAEGKEKYCTAALLGPQVVLTAAHCVPISGKVFVKAPGQANSKEVGCTTNPAYEQGADPSADYALCKIPNAVPPFPGLVYERVDLSSFDDHVRKPVILTGYGCTSDLVSEQEHSDKKYRVGRNTIVGSSNSADLRFGAEFYKGFQDNNLFTDDDPRQVIANLCPGDSGGPAFRRSAGGAAQFTNRQIIGVNSRVFYRDILQTSFGASVISATGTQRFSAWATAWARGHHVEACGLTDNATNCRL